LSQQIEMIKAAVLELRSIEAEGNPPATQSLTPPEKPQNRQNP
jgi:hypothetical protein